MGTQPPAGKEARVIEPYQRPLVITHGNCRDGFCSKWIASLHFRRPEVQAACSAPVEYVDGFYGQEPPDVAGRDVYIIDFSYPRETMIAIANTCRRLVVLDHHKTAQAALEDFPHFDGVAIHFDMERSGAGMAWDHFMGKPRPWVVNYVEDRDLWRNALDDSEAVSAYISTMAFDFEVWDDEMRHGNIARAKVAGWHVVAKTRQYVAEVRKNAFLVDFEGYTVPLVNAPQYDISELLVGMMGEWQLDPLTTFQPQFVMGWWQCVDKRFQYSLRSRGDFDVSALAKRYGGGGHKNAAGFQCVKPLHLMDWDAARATVNWDRGWL